MEKETKKQDKKTAIIIAVAISIIVIVIAVINVNNFFNVIKPTSSKIETNNSIESQYNKALSLVKDGKYKQARDILKADDVRKYKDALSYIYYCNGMINYEEYKCYGDAIETLGKCENILNAKEIKQKMLDKVGQYNGTYIYKNPKSQFLNNYMFVKDGKVAFCAESSYNASDEQQYSYSLCEDLINENNAKNGALMLAYGFTKTPTKSDYKYLFSRLPDGRYYCK